MNIRRILVSAGALVLAAACAIAPPKPEGELRYRMREDPPSLDPFRAADDNSLVYIYLLFDGLVEYLPGTVEVRPAVAESWTVSPDGLTYTFKLRAGVRFHNGREVTAEDVAYSVRRAITRSAHSEKRLFFNALNGAAEFWDGKRAELPGVAAPDPRTVVMTLAYPYGAFLTILASEAGSILPREVYDDPGEGYLKNPVGCGPYRFDSRETGVSITLTRFADHWKSPPPSRPIQRITIQMIGNVATGLEEYRAGNIDFTMEIPPDQRKRLQQELPDHFHSQPKLMLFYLGINHASGPLKDKPLVRRAISHAIDREYIVRVLQEGKDTVATGIIPPGMLGHDPGNTALTYDPNQGAKLLAEAGYPDGKGLPEITYLTNITDGLRLTADRILSDLSRIGLKVRIKMVDLGAFLDALRAGSAGGPDAALYRMGYYADYPDPDNFLTEQFAPGGGGNFGRYADVALDQILEQARRETDRARREALYRQAEDLLLDEAAIVPIYWYGQDVLLRPEIKGMRLSPMGYFAIAWEEMSLQE